MLPVKGIYKDGHAELIEPIRDFVSQPDLHLIIIQRGSVLSVQDIDEFSALGLGNFFGTQDDKGVDWDTYFGLA